MLLAQYLEDAGDVPDRVNRVVRRLQGGAGGAASAPTDNRKRKREQESVADSPGKQRAFEQLKDMFPDKPDR